MATVYKSLERRKEEDDLSNASEGTELTDESSGTVQGDATTSPLASLPLELRNRVLMLTSRGVSFRHRHLLSDLHSLLPHTYKDTKLDTKSSNNYNATLNAIAELHGCNHIFFLEARKHGQDLYLWLARPPNGPTIKFSVSNVHTMGELGFGGNCLKGGRGIVVFDKSFEDAIEQGNEYKLLVREMLSGVFCVPARGVRGMKPFIDRIIGVFGLDGKIWVRVYEIREADRKSQDDGKTTSEVSLIEVGPRLVLTPIVILEGSFGGPVIYENKEYVSPNQIRSEARTRRAGKYARRRGDAEDRQVRKEAMGLDRRGMRQKGQLDNSTLFA